MSVGANFMDPDYLLAPCRTELPGGCIFIKAIQGNAILFQEISPSLLTQPQTSPVPQENGQ